MNRNFQLRTPRLLRLFAAWLLLIGGAAPVAVAQNLTASSVVPTVNLNDTNPVAGGGPRNIWDMSGGEASISPCSNANTDLIWRLEADGTTDVIAICSRGVNATDSIVVDTAGDLSLGSNSVFVDRSADRLGIGTTAPVEDIHIQNSSPGIRLDDSSVVYDIEESADDLRIFINSNTGTGDPTGEALTLEDSNGYFGIWQPNPSAPLQVQSPTGQDARISVINPVAPTAAGDVVMLSLANTGPKIVRFGITANAQTWTFDNNPNVNGAAGANAGQFRIAKVGTGVAELTVNGFGDGTFARNSFAVNHINTSSRKSKTDFQPIDEMDVLEKLAAMPITRWRYRAEDPAPENEHIGPVAEDFQGAFGLGDGEHISTVDSGGVALAAIKGVHRNVQTVGSEVEALRSDLAERDEQLRLLTDRMARLEALLTDRHEPTLAMNDD